MQAVICEFDTVQFPEQVLIPLTDFLKFPILYTWFHLCQNFKWD